MSDTGRLAGHVFISYVREDSVAVDRVQAALEAAGIRVWRDTADLRPGDDWRARIRRVISGETRVFLACFSRNGLARERTFQREELFQAIEELRLRSPDVPWLFPVRFDNCPIPDWDIGAGRTLDGLQSADLFGDHVEDQISQLVRAVTLALRPGHTAGQEEGRPPGIGPDGVTPAGPIKRDRRRALAAAAGLAAAAVIAGVIVVAIIGSGPQPRHDGRHEGAGITAASMSPSTGGHPGHGQRASLIAASFPAPGSGPVALAFDGRDFWMTDDSATIFQVDTGGQIDASYPSPDATPEGITWDGRSFWLYTAGLGLIYHVQIKNGGIHTLGSIDPHSQSAGLIHNVVWAGGDIWWSEDYKAELLTTAAKVLRQITKGSEITGLAWDGTHLWFAYDNFPNGSRIEEATSSGTTIRTFTVPITGLSSLVWADNSLWTLGQNAQDAPTRVYRLGL